MAAAAPFAIRVMACAWAVSPRAALQGAAWFVWGKRARGRNMVLTAAAQSEAYYALWQGQVEPARMSRLVNNGSRLTAPMHLVVWGVEGAAAEQGNGLDTRRSVEAAAARATQVHGDRLKVSFAGRLLGAPDEAVLLPEEANWLLPIVVGDRLAPAALLELVEAAVDAAGPNFVFWDEDRLVEGRRCDPWVKGALDPLLFFARDGLVGACAVRVDSAGLAGTCDWSNDHRGASVFAWLAGLLLKRRADIRAAQIPAILTHRANAAAAVDASSRAAALSALAPVSPIAHAHVDPGIPDMVRPQPPLPTPTPSVAIIIPTRDRAGLLKTCLDSLSQLRYAGRVEFVVVDNGSQEPDALELLAGLRAQGMTVLRDDGDFNFSRLNNTAVAACDTDFVCLLNNDIEALDGDWLARLVAFAALPDSGCAGTVLTYPGGAIQHAGVEIGVGGAAGHAHRLIPFDNAGHHWLHRTTREVSAVTAACLVVRRNRYLEVGGLDEQAFAVAFNDVDFCLKLRSRGWRNILVADAVLVHYESVSRLSDFLPENIVRFSKELAALQERWGTVDALDPFRSPLLARQSERHVLWI